MRLLPLAALAFCALPSPSAQAQSSSQAISVSVPPSTATAAINRLAAQAGVDVVVAVDLRGRQSRGLNGRFTVDAAFDRLLTPLGARARRFGPGIYRVEAAVMSPVQTPAAPLAQPSDIITELDEIVVTAPVGRGGLVGGNGRVPIDPLALDRFSDTASSEAVADLSATVESTRQGTGRNKIFVRGLADSAFSGPLQSTVGQYLGDIRLTYGSPDPDLPLVDIRSIDVFEGPQGARFATGSIGGVLLIQPEPPRLGVDSISLSGGASATSSGSPGYDAALIANAPVGTNAAWRVAAYARRDGGFINAATPGASRADGVDTLGARVSARFVEAGWTVDGIAVVQRIAADNAQLISLDSEAGGTAVRLLQPYSSDLMLAGVSASRRFRDFKLTSVTSISRQRLQERFDASQPDDLVPVANDRAQTTTALAIDTRLEAQPGARWSWSGGVAIALGTSRVDQDEVTMGFVEQRVRMQSRNRRFAEAAVLGEAVVALSPNVSVSIGGRLSYVRVINDVDTLTSGRSSDAGDQTDATPSLAVTWASPLGPEVFARYDEGLRPGGISVAEEGPRIFKSDRVRLFETGLRTPTGLLRWSAEASVGHLDWQDIQADTVTTGGDLVTRNLGDGTVRFVQARAAWRPSEVLSLTGGVFVNDSQVVIAGLGTIGGVGGPIPNVAPFGASASVAWGPILWRGRPIHLAADLRYVGPSIVGFGVGLDGPQGGYVRTGLSARFGDDRRALTLRISNPLDVSGSRFGIGSPYRVFDPQYAPVRPLTVRIGFDAAF